MYSLGPACSIVLVVFFFWPNTLLCAGDTGIPARKSVFGQVGSLNTLFCAGDTGIPARKSVFGQVGSQNTLFCAGTTCKRVAPPGPLTSHPWSPPRFHESANHYTLSLPSDPPGHSWRGALATAPSTSDRRRLRAPALGAGTQLLALASSSSAQRQTLALALGAALKALGASSWRTCPAKGWRLARVFAAGSWRWRLKISQSWRPALAPSDCAL